MTSDHFRRSYDEARRAGFDGTRAEFCRLILGAPYLFRGALVAAARAWDFERGEAVASGRGLVAVGGLAPLRSV